MKGPSTARANAKLRLYLQSLHGYVDEVHREPKRQHAGIQCRPGCTSAAAGCCSLLVLIERTEAEFIVDRNPEAVAAALPKLVEHVRRMDADAELGAGILRMFTEEGAERGAASRYHALDMPCAFLGPDQLCTIYRDRPIPCRTHFVLSPPELCTTQGPEPMHVTLDKGTRAAAPAMLMREVGKRRGGQLEFGTLPHLVLAAVTRGR